MKYVVMFSGGAGSWGAGKRLRETVSAEDVVLLFADTLIEDASLYPFMDAAARNIGVPLTKIADGRTPWQLFRDVRFLGNTRIDPCSRVLKRDLLRAWLENHCDPHDTTVVYGIDWSESHRLDGPPGKPGIRERMQPWTVDAPMCRAPLLTKCAILEWAKQEGLQLPRLYELGFPHNNCGGGCVKAGQAHFAHLYKLLPDVFATWEREERETMLAIDSDKTILRDRRGGTTKPMTLTQLRQRIEAGEDFSDAEWGGCGCAID
jgi:hypothetical protein